MVCPLCGDTATREVFRFLRPPSASPTGRPTERLYGRAGRLVRCEGCGLIRQDPVVPAPYEDAVDEAFLREEEGLRVTSRRTLTTIERHRPPPGRLLEVGCGPGVLLDEAAERGWDALGIEPSAWAAEEGRRRGRSILAGRFEEVDLEPGSIDAAALCDVIEHIAEPIPLMTRLRDALSPGGVVFVSTPDTSSIAARLLRRRWWSVLPGHLLYFTRDTLERMLANTGFDVLEVRTDPKTFSLGYYLGRLGGYVPPLSRLHVGRGPATRLVSPDLKDRIAVVARKRSSC